MPNLYFYSLQFKENDTLLSKFEFQKQLFRKIDGQESIKIEENGPESIIFDVLKVATYDKPTVTIDGERSDFLFGRLGKEKDITYLQKRDKNTLMVTDIEKEEQEYVEAITYFYIFFDLNVIVYLNALSAPRIDTLCKLFSGNCNQKLDILPIVTKDALKLIKQKQIINSAVIKLQIPKDSELNIKALGLTEKEFDELRKQNDVSIEIQIKAGRNQNAFLPTVFEKSINKILNIANPNKLKAKAKNEGENLKEYNLIEDRFITQVKFKYESAEVAMRREEIKQIILKEYIRNRKEIRKYIKE
ncbi:hypothetical protein [Filifactor alocis]